MPFGGSAEAAAAAKPRPAARTPDKASLRKAVFTIILQMALLAN